MIASVLKVEVPKGAVGTRAGAGAGAGAGVGASAEVDAGVEVGAEVEASEGSQALVLWVPENVIMGSSRFQQFFRIKAKLMAGLRDSKVRESGTTPLAMHKAMIMAGKPSREELD